MAANRGAPGPYRRNVDKNRSSTLSAFKTLLEDKEITIKVYIKHVLKSYNFECLEKKIRLMWLQMF